MATTHTEILRNYAFACKVVSLRQIREELGLTEAEAFTAAQNLAKKKILKRVARGVYQWLPASYRHEPGLEDKIWKAMKTKTVFSAADIAYVVGCSEGEVYQAIQRYVPMRFVLEKGKRRQDLPSERKKRPVQVWSLSQAGREMPHRPVLSERDPDPVVLMAIRLNRLVLTGRIRRDGKTRGEARLLAQELADELGRAGGRQPETGGIQGPLS